MREGNNHPYRNTPCTRVQTQDIQLVPTLPDPYHRTCMSLLISSLSQHYIWPVIDEWMLCSCGDKVRAALPALALTLATRQRANYDWCAFESGQGGFECSLQALLLLYFAIEYTKMREQARPVTIPTPCR